MLQFHSSWNDDDDDVTITNVAAVAFVDELLPPRESVYQLQLTAHAQKANEIADKEIQWPCGIECC
jgi:hypothetical protein